jgi:predicted HAD superfamily Cof-like phosphohydrolase
MAEIDAYGHEPQNDVADFHAAMEIPIGQTPALRRVELRMSLLGEELAEISRAVNRKDLVGAIDGLCDLVYVAYGAAVEWGIDLKPFWDEVHKANMAKTGGAKRADGKQLKPAGWKPPDIERILAEQM